MNDLADWLPGVWLRLFREAGLGRLELGFGLDALMLTADEVEAMTARQGALETEAEAKQAESLAALIDRLTARLGEDRVLTSEPVDSWIPERAERWRPALGRSPAAATAGGTPALASAPWMHTRPNCALRDRPSLAVRLSVTKIATEQPWVVVGAIVGVLLGGAGTLENALHLFQRRTCDRQVQMLG